MSSSFIIFQMIDEDRMTRGKAGKWNERVFLFSYYFLSTPRDFILHSFITMARMLLLASCLRLSTTAAFQSSLLPSGSWTSMIQQRTAAVACNKNKRSGLQRLFVVAGGDFAGLSANFDGQTGKLIPVPEHLVPESLLEWGQAPIYLEVITSETLVSEGENNDNGDKNTLQRQTVSVLPAVGCSIDNLDTTKSVETTDNGHLAVLGDDIMALEYPLLPLGDTPRSRVETTFGLSDNAEDLNRIRVALTALWSEEFKIASPPPVTVVMERRTSFESSSGSIADGGGLDGRTVTTLIGKELQREPFTKQSPLDASVLRGSWQCIQEAEVDEPPPLCDDGSTELFLPGNIVIRYKTESSSRVRLDVMQYVGTAKRNIVRRFYEDGKLVEGLPQSWTEILID